MPRPCSLCDSPLSPTLTRKLKQGVTHDDIVRWLREEGVEVHRTTIGRHARHVIPNVERRTGPRPTSTDLLELVRDRVVEDVQDGVLSPTISHGLHAVAQLDARNARSADSALLRRIALALAGQSRPMVEGRVLEPWEVELEREQAPYRKLLQSGDQERDAFAEEDARRLHELQR